MNERHVGPRRAPQVQRADGGGGHLIDVFVPHPARLPTDSPRSERTVEIEEIVHEVTAPFGIALAVNERIERIARSEVDVVEPRRDDPQPAQIAALLVRDGVVGIVAPLSRHSEPSLHDPGKPPARHRANLAVASSLGRGQHTSQTLRRERSLAVVRIEDPGVRIDHHSGGVQAEEMILGDVPAERVEDPRRDDLGRGGEVGIAAWIEFDEIVRAGRIPHPEARLRAELFAREHDERSVGSRRRAEIRTALERLRGERLARMSVGEPRRVGNLVERVDVDRFVR